MFNTIKKFFVILFRRADKAVEEMEDGVEKCKNAQTQIKTFITDLDRQLVNVLHHRRKFELMTYQNANDIDDYMKEAANLKKSGKPEEAKRYMRRVITLEKRAEQSVEAKARTEKEVERIKSLRVELLHNYHDLDFEINDLQSRQEFANFRIATNEKVRGVGKLDNINDIIESARRKVEDNVMLADSYDDVADLKEEESERNSVTTKEDEIVNQRFEEL